MNDDSKTKKHNPAGFELKKYIPNNLISHLINELWQEFLNSFVI